MKRLLHKKYILFALAASAVLSAALAYINSLRLPLLEKLDNLVYDTMMVMQGQTKPDPRVVIVDIDDISLNELGQWPWPRNLVADLIDKIFENGALAIGVDILFAEPDRSSPLLVADELAKLTGKRPDLAGLPPEDLDHDLRLKQAITNRPVVLGTMVVPSDVNKAIGKIPHSTPYVERRYDNPENAYKIFEQLSKESLAPAHESFAQINDIQLPLEKLEASIGVFNMNSETTARSVPLLYRSHDQVVATLSVATLQKLFNKPLFFITDKKGDFTLRFHKKLKFPVENAGTYRPFFRGPTKTFPYYSAAEIINNQIDKNSLEGKIVLIGSTAAGLMDFRNAPFDPLLPGVEIHATVIDNILNGKGLIKPAYSLIFIVAGSAICVTAASLLFCLAPVWIYSLAGGGFALAAILASYQLFQKEIFIPPILPILGILLSALLCLPVRHFLYERQSRLLKSSFSRYVSPEVVNRIVAKGGAPMAGSQREVSILFTDVRNFTGISENLAPDKLVALLNTYFTPMTACVTSNEGTLDKFIGDALMAFWNAPIDVENHQGKAVAAALAMQQSLAKLRPQFKKNFGIDLFIGCGINSGNVQVGNMGSNELQDYTCIGDNVNLASRLEGLCRTYGCDIVVSETVRDACKDQYYFRQLDRVRVKGKNKFVDIFLPFAKTAPLNLAKEKLWAEALQAYFDGQFKKAEKLFAQLQDEPSMAVAVRLFLRRCADFAANPPQKWDGVWKYASK